MQATDEDPGLLAKIRPPRLEDAGLEDCALPLDSIHEAFLKAATAVASRAASVFAGDGDEGDDACVTDPWTEKSTPSDALVGINPKGSPPGPCANGKGGALIGEGDLASDVVGQRNESETKGKDEVVVVGGGGGGDCVDGLRGLEIKSKGEERKHEDEEDKKPTLVEGYLLNP